MDDRQLLFELWTPPSARYAPWAKPVLFAQMATGAAPPDSQVSDLPVQPWADFLEGRTAVVLDLPGESSVSHALALVAHGLQPVPLFNGCAGPGACIDVESIMMGLRRGAAHLRHSVPADAPPAFMLDSNRTAGKPPPGSFDNRWVVFPQDFPSGRFLLAHGLARVLVVHQQACKPADDLKQVLAAWKKSGIEIFGVEEARKSPAPLPVTKPWPLRPFAALALLALGLRSNSAGGFGAKVPLPPEGGRSGGLA
ncbi:MAG: hypothetical protein KJZ65_12515 [Phycisphaerales bacterium]|nr:hypothetical protein [Phycisphaerales bacterium]